MMMALDDDDESEADGLDEAAALLLNISVAAPVAQVVPPTPTKLSFLDKLEQNRNLRIFKEKQVKELYEKKGVTGLFGLFVDKKLKGNILQWTNTRLSAHNETLLTLEELDAWLGLQLAMSLVPLSNMRDYWCGNVILGQGFFQAVMGRDRFLLIRSKLALHEKLKISFMGKFRDPFWNFRGLMRHFHERFAKTAEPFGNTALDEMGIRFSGRHRGVTYAPNKPEKFAFQFYAEAHFKSGRLSQMQINDSGVIPKMPLPSTFKSMGSFKVPS